MSPNAGAILRDLQSDYIDFYMVHYPDPKVDIRSTVEVLFQAQGEGKIRFIGLCNTNWEQLALAREVATIDVVQSEFNFCSTHEMEQFLLQLEERDIGFMGWGTLHKGVLTGSATRERQYQACDVRSWAPWFHKDQKVAEQMQWAREVLFPRLEEGGIRPAHFALQFVLSFSALSTALCGFRSLRQLDDLLEGMEEVVDPSLFRKLRDSYHAS